MTADQLTDSAVRIEAENIGGISEASVTLPPGVSVLTGENATNRTSFLTALMAGLGSTRASLKGDAEHGSVRLDVDGETYTRTLQRQGDTVAFSGDPFLDDPELADLFAFLLEDNEARRTIARGDGLRELLMRPVDTDRIDAEIDSCKQRRDEIEEELDRLDRLETEIPELEAERRNKKEELDSVRDELDAVQTEIEEFDRDLEQSRSRKEDLEAAFQRVRDARSELEELEFDLETDRSTLEELESERSDLQNALADAEEPEESPDRLTGRVQELRDRKRTIDDTISELGSVVSFNEEMLEDEGVGLELPDDRSSGAPTEELVTDEITCWTCGSSVSTDEIAATLDRLRRLRSEKLDERRDIESSIDELTEKRSELRDRRQELENARERLETVESEIETTEDRIADLESRIETKREEVEELEAEAESIEVGDHEELLDLHRESNELELRVESLESDIEALDTEIAEREEAIETRDELEAERDDVAQQLTDLRTRIEDLEADAVESFNTHMGTVLDILEYDNLGRIWIERRQERVREGRRKVEQTRFDLHIVRSAEDGSAYEDTVEHLSESEREVTGLVFALAGYLVHDVYDQLPFIVLDSLEAIDSQRIARVVEYFRTHASYITVALLPEDAAALSDEYSYITSIESVTHD
jgi:peptidoglycan hydrolase CwlO-like protein